MYQNNSTLDLTHHLIAKITQIVLFLNLQFLECRVVIQFEWMDGWIDGYIFDL